MPIFPDRGLDQTLHLAVLLGVWVLLFCTEAFGWVYAGLVVPGYLASVFVIAPGSGVAVVIESILTFVVAREICRVLSLSSAGSELFGRERFFLIVLVSVIVRQGAELWLLPTLAQYTDMLFQTTFEQDRTWSSIGLVLVPLTANAFWKLDVPRGIFQVGVPVLLVWALLTFVFLPWTNLSYASVRVTYEDAALDFINSPKPYLLLLLGSYLASWANLRYGWDYNGIMVPALLTLTCLEPKHIVVTAIEAVGLVFLSKGVFQLPVIRSINLEGPRKVAVVFSISFIVKLLLGYFLSDRLPWFSANDTFGFGYLLSSLMAVKMLAKKVVGRIVWPTIVVAVLSFLIGNAIGFLGNQVTFRLQKPLLTKWKQSTPMDMERWLMLAEARVRTQNVGKHPLTLPVQEQARYRDAVMSVWGWVGSAAWETGAEPPMSVLSSFRLAGLDAIQLTQQHVPEAERIKTIGVWEQESSLSGLKGWGAMWIRPGQPGPVVLVPYPKSHKESVEAAKEFCQETHCALLWVNGVDAHASGYVPGDVYENSKLIMHHVAQAKSPRTFVWIEKQSGPGVQVFAGEDIGTDVDLHRWNKMLEKESSIMGLTQRLTLQFATPERLPPGWMLGKSMLIRINRLPEIEPVVLDDMTLAEIRELAWKQKTRDDIKREDEDISESHAMALYHNVFRLFLQGGGMGKTETLVRHAKQLGYGLVPVSDGSWALVPLEDKRLPTLIYHSRGTKGQVWECAGDLKRFSVAYFETISEWLNQIQPEIEIHYREENRALFVLHRASLLHLKKSLVGKGVEGFVISLHPQSMGAPKTDAITWDDGILGFEASSTVLLQNRYPTFPVHLFSTLVYAHETHETYWRRLYARELQVPMIDLAVP